MKEQAYDDLQWTYNFREFWFTSRGTKGDIVIVIRFDRMKQSQNFSLSFGKISPDDSIDVEARVNNGDMNKILSTVVMAICRFLDNYPDNFVFFMGSTPARTRLYRMMITNNLEELTKQFEIYGGNNLNETWSFRNFKKEISYSGFAIKNKKINLHYEK